MALAEHPNTGARAAHFVIALILSLLTASQAAAQSTGTKPPNQAAGAPAGSYSLSGFENVNLYSGNLNFHLPLLQIGGRGGVNVPVMVSINSVKWNLRRGRATTNTGSDTARNSAAAVVHEEFGQDVEEWHDQLDFLIQSFQVAKTYTTIRGSDGFYREASTESEPVYWWLNADVPANDVRPGYGPGVLQARTVSIGGSERFGRPGKVLTRIVFVTPDGTEYELRDQQTGGNPYQPAPHDPAGVPQSDSRGSVFVSADGQGATFVADAAITERFNYQLNTRISYPSGYLLLPDGTRYRISQGNVEWIRDRNGNLTRFAYETSFNSILPGPVSHITDSLGRRVDFRYNVAPSSGAACPDPSWEQCVYDEISFKGMGDAPKVTRIWYSNLKSLLRSGQLGTYGSLFQAYEQDPDEQKVTYNPGSVLGAVELPDGRYYKLKYNAYNELAQVMLPTGGVIEYDYVGLGSSVEIQRGIKERRVYRNATDPAPESKQVYERSINTIVAPYVTTMLVEQRDGSGAALTRERHYFYGHSLTSQRGFYTQWREGREFETETLSPLGDAASAPVLRRVENVWEARSYVGWYTGSQDTGPAADPRLKETRTALTDTTPVLSAKQLYYYDPDPSLTYNLQTKVEEYGYDSARVRWTETEYLKSAAYTGASIHLRGLPLRKSVYDAATGKEMARTAFEYDNYSSEAGHAALLQRSDITGLCTTFDAGQCANQAPASYQTRGNVTATTSYLLDALGNVTGSVTSYAQHDVAGNVVKSVDARGYATSFAFTDNFGTPDSDAQNGAVPAQLGGRATYAFATKVTNALGHTSYTQYDYSTGLVVNTEDANGIVSLVRYDDSLNRPTQADRAVNVTNLRNQMSFQYDDVNRVITTTRDQGKYGDNLLKGELLYDGLGRTVESHQYETATDYITTLTNYDTLGRVAQVSNPFRAFKGETPVWTKTSYDALGRVTGVITPDGAQLTTLYDGARTLVTDQAGRRRLSTTDALGHLTDVWEVTSEDEATEAISFPVPQGFPAVSAGYHTYYTYDVLGDLTQVEQGGEKGQRRYFAYDSLKRLSSAQNPESGRIDYTYDANGNLKTRTDTRGIVTTNDYDELSRLMSVTYSDGITPSVAYTYDTQPLPTGAPTFDRGFSTGRLVALTYGGNGAGNYMKYDQLGQVAGSLQVTDIGANRQSYSLSYDYDLAGNLRSETYPSGRTIINSYDMANRINALSGQNPGQADKTYVSNVQYAAHGAPRKMTLGNGLVESAGYNTRLQVSSITLATAGSIKANPSTVPSESYDAVFNVSYDYGTADNNGNVHTQTITMPGGKLIQDYDYDQLNRLKQATETDAAGQQTWKQAFNYDVYGNRNFAAGTTTLAAKSLVDPNNNPIINHLNNQIDPTKPGQDKYLYDPAGNLKHDQFHTFDYDAENRQIKYDGGSSPATGGASYSYDGAGRRVKKTRGGGTTVFVYDAMGQLVAEYNDTASASGNGTQYVTADTLGSPRVITDAAGMVKERHDYMPFGEEVSSSYGGRSNVAGYGVDTLYDVNTLRKKFTGYERDFESGLDYAQARYYSSVQGRFTSVDPSRKSIVTANPQSWNRYLYCLNNPFSYVDSNGKWPTRTHNNIIDTALPGLSKWERYAIKRGSLLVDYTTLLESHAPQHAMTPAFKVREFEGKGFSHEQALAKAKEWSRNEMKKFINDKLDNATHSLNQSNNSNNNSDRTFYIERSLQEFGGAIHAPMDNYSPTHSNFQVFDGSSLYTNYTVDIATGVPISENYWAELAAHQAGEERDPTAEEMQAMVTEIQAMFRRIYGDKAAQRAFAKPK
jgi:RHS repeat-associated protein